MPPETATVEIYRGGNWQPAGRLQPARPELGYRGASSFEYLLDYAADHASPECAPAAGLSCHYPVDFDIHQLTCWPAFILDILPSGYGRRQWLEQLEITDGPTSDWPLLMRGAAFPPGNMRIAEAVTAKNRTLKVPAARGDLVPIDRHPGFNRNDVLARGEHFIEYAYQLGIYAAGGSDVQGVAPKLLLTQDLEGAWHAEGVLSDDRVMAHWLVKRPRGTSAADRQVLKNEQAYMRVARKLGLHVHDELSWVDNHLFIPRFDRLVHAGKYVERLGMESLCSLAGISEFGAMVSHDTLCRALIQFSSEPERDLLEYIKRDILNIVLGNKDNHSRNTAVLRYESGDVALAPLFDFAPMYLDPEGIARVCRWEGDAEHAGNPEWAVVLARWQSNLNNAETALRNFGQEIARLPDTMHKAGVDEFIIEHRTPAIEQHSHQLLAL
jgi:serine/threonine-protein kinase HipA